MVWSDFKPAGSLPARQWCQLVNVGLVPEIQGWPVINGRGRAPLIVIPDTGTRPRTKRQGSRVPLSITFQWSAAAGASEEGAGPRTLQVGPYGHG